MNKWVGLFVLLLIGCASSPRTAAPTGDRTARGFPTRDKVASVSHLEASVSQAGEMLDVETWTFAGPFPETYKFTKYVDDRPWTKYLEDLAAKTQGEYRPTVAMNCVARELARFHVEHKKKPSFTFERYLAAQCKAPMTGFGYHYVTGQMPADVSEGEVWDRVAADVQAIVQVAGAGPHSTALVHRRDGDQILFMYVYAARDVQITAVTRGEDRFIIEGRILKSAQSLRSMSTVGAYGAADCVEDVTQKLPVFRWECTVDPNDDAVWIEFAAFRAGSLFGDSIATLRVHPKGPPSPIYTRPTRGQDMVVDSAASFEKGLVDAINRLRGDAGLSALTVEAAQSRDAASVALPYFAARLGQLDPSVAETVALGLRAGWNVSETVRYGHFGSALSVGTANLAALLATLLDTPFGREVVLDSNVRRLSVGTIFNEERQIFGAIFGTYALFDRPNQQLRSDILARLSAARSTAGRAPAKVITVVADDILKVEAAVKSGEQTPNEALNTLLARATAKLRKGTTGYVLQASDINSIQIPPDLTTIPDLEVAIAVTHTQAGDEPWGTYVVLIVLEAPTRTTTARADAPQDETLALVVEERTEHVVD